MENTNIVESTRRANPYFGWICCQCQLENQGVEDEMKDDDIINWRCNNRILDYKSMVRDADAVGAQPVPSWKIKLIAKWKQFMNKKVHHPVRYKKCGHKFFHCAACKSKDHDTQHVRTELGGANPNNLPSFYECDGCGHD